MYKLIQLELKRNKLKPYYTALAIISIVMTGFLYLIATIAKVEKVDLFSDYGNILKMHTVITFIVFCVFSTVLFSKFVIEDYSRQRALLLFSYPISRTKIFAAKLILVSGFITAGFLVSTLVPNILFFITEGFAPILGGNITTSIVLAQLMNVTSFILAILSIGFISLRIGFINKSVSGTIVTAILLAAILGNVLMGLGASIYAFVGVIIFFAIGLGFAKSTNNQIIKMEV